MTLTRRDILRTSLGLATGAMGARFLAGPAQAEESLKFKPEEGATLRLLRWAPFVKGDEDQWVANTKKFTVARGMQPFRS